MPSDASNFKWKSLIKNLHFNFFLSHFFMHRKTFLYLDVIIKTFHSAFEWNKRFGIWKSAYYTLFNPQRLHFAVEFISC